MKHGAKAVLGAAAAMVVAACGAQPAQQGMPPARVTVATPLTERVADWDEFVGRFEAPERVEVRARASGFIEAAHFRDGQAVRKGQLLFTLDPRPAQAQLASARAQLSQAQAQVGLARNDFNRAQTLLDATAISREEFESRRAAVTQAEAQVQAAEAAVRARTLDLEFTRVTAPISGVVSERRIDPGNVVTGGASSGDVLTTIVSTSPIHFAFDASEAVLLKYRRGGAGTGRIQVRLQDEPDYRWAGTLDFTDNAVDDASGAVRMRALVSNPNGLLRPGMFGHARLQGTSAYSALLIPDTAVVADGPRRLAYVVDAAGTVQPKPIQTGPMAGGLRVVRSGLTPADRVVIDGIQRAMPGAKVQAVQGRVVRPAAQEQGAPTIAAPPASLATPVN